MRILKDRELCDKLSAGALETALNAPKQSDFEAAAIKMLDCLNSVDLS